MYLINVSMHVNTPALICSKDVKKGALLKRKRIIDLGEREGRLFDLEG
jgi:hypothetical protein